MSEQKVFNRWFVVFGALLIQMCLGAVYAWSLFNQPLADKFGWAIKDIVLTFSITIAVFSVTTIFAGKIQDKIGPRWVATAGGLLLGVGLFLTSQATSLMQIYIFYGVIGGIGIGAAYVCPLATCLKWFPDKRGLISGLAVAGFGAGALVFKPIILSFIASAGVSMTFTYLGVIFAIAVVIGAQFLQIPPAGYKPEGWTPPVTAGGTTSVRNFTTGQMMKTMHFYVIWIIYLFGTTSGLMVIGLAKDIGTKLVKLTPADAANAVVIVAIFNAVGRIVWGTLSDKLGRVTSLLCMYILSALAMVFMGMVDMNYMSFLAACSVIGFCFGGFLALFPSITADYYGTANVGINYGIIFCAYGLAAIVGPKIGAAMPFTQAFIISAVLCAIAAIMTFLIRKAPQG